MRTPSVDWLSRYLRSAGLVAAGSIIGAALFMALYQHNFSLLYMENEQLKTENEDMRKTLDPLLQSKNQSATIRQIKINLFSAPGTEPLEEIVSIQLKRQLGNDLETLRGKSSDTAAESLLVARRIIERKIYTLARDQEYAMNLVLIMIQSGELAIWSEIRPFIRSN